MSQPSTLPLSESGLASSFMICAVDGPGRRDIILGMIDADADAYMDYIQEWLDATGHFHPLRPSAMMLLLELAEQTGRIPLSIQGHTNGDFTCQPEAWRSGGNGYIYRGTYNGHAVVIKRVSRNKQMEAIKEMLIWRQVEAGDTMLPFVGVDGCAWQNTQDIAFITAFGGVTLRDYINNSYFNLTHQIVETANWDSMSGYSPDMHRQFVLLQIARGIHFLHSQDIVHGDLTSWNILIDEAQHGVQICDFGLSSLVIPALHQPKLGAGALGSPHFMAPEQFEERGGHLRKEVDIWAFGCVCWMVCTGRIPFDYASSMMVLIHVLELNDPPGFTNNLVRYIGTAPTDDLVEMVRQCWSQDPTTRPTSSSILAHFGDYVPGALPPAALCTVSVKQAYMPTPDEDNFLELKEGERLLVFDIEFTKWFVKTNEGAFGYVHESCLHSPEFILTGIANKTTGPNDITLPIAPRWACVGKNRDEDIAKLPELAIGQGESVTVVTVTISQWIVRDSRRGIIGYADPSALDIAWPDYQLATGKMNALRTFEPPQGSAHMLPVWKGEQIQYIPRSDNWVVAWKHGAGPGLIPVTCIRWTVIPHFE